MRSYKALLWVAVVGAVLAILLFPLGIFAHPHDDDGQTHEGVAADTDDHIHIHYDENGTGAVRDFDSTDPEGSGIEWNVRGVDAADFAISSTGVLTFMESPDYENSTDRGLDLNANGDFTGTGEFAPGDNYYQITVSATEMSDALPAKRTDIDLTVIVGNVDDDGELTLQWLQPEVTTEIGTTLIDPDGATSDPTWTWYTSKAADPEVGNLFHWNVVTGPDTASYTPLAADEDKYLWVHVAYTDPQGGNKTADAKSENTVRAEVTSGNGSPDFVEETDTRTVPESMDVGGDVGLPVVATDPDPEDTVTYELEAAADDNARDVEFFNIDKATGQITVAQDLDYDAVGARTDGATAGTYMVIVKATDPSSLADLITITITAENVNEAPKVTGRAELSVVEGITENGALVYETLIEQANNANRYLPVEQDSIDSIATWHLEGDDKGAFDLSGNFEPRYLQFKAAPDFENPIDENRDNIYEVTIVATDTDPLETGPGIGKTNVAVMVTSAEEAGKVVFTAGETAYLNEMLVAEVQDPDDHGGDLGEPYQGVHVVSWQWSKSTSDSGMLRKLL